MKGNFILEKYMDDVNLCDDLIEYFKSREDKKPGKIYSRNLNESVINLNDKQSTDVPIHEKDVVNSDVLQRYINELQKTVDLYNETYPYANHYGPWSMIEIFNIQHYKPNEGFFVWHSERTSAMNPATTRHLVFMTYLNDVMDGGETEFYHQELKVKPKKGLTLIWPADWTHTHRGVASPTQDKYIVTGWFNYV
jgi:prolyl 4-hydroxylase